MFESRNFYNAKRVTLSSRDAGQIPLTPRPSMISFPVEGALVSKPSLWEDVMVRNWVKPLPGSFILIYTFCRREAGEWV